MLARFVLFGLFLSLVPGIETPAQGSENRSLTIILPEAADSIAVSAAELLRAQLGDTPRIRTSTLTSTSDGAPLLAYWRQHWPEDTGILILTALRRIVVIRRHDGRRWVRALEPEMITGSPHPIAVAARELVELVWDSGSPSVRARATRSGERDGRGSTFLRFGVDGGVSLAVSAGSGHEPILSRPAVGVRAMNYPAGLPWWFGLGVRARGLTSVDWSPPSAAFTASGEPLRMEYQRTDLDLRVLGGWSSDRLLDLSIEGLVGLSSAVAVASTIVDTDAESEVARNRRETTNLGAGCEIRIFFLDNFAAFLGGSTRYVLTPTRYHVADQTFEEGRVRIHLDAGLAWEPER